MYISQQVCTDLKLSLLLKIAISQIPMCPLHFLLLFLTLLDIQYMYIYM